MPRALISVYNKEGVVDFASALHELGWQLISSGGTAQAIAAAGLPVTDVADITGLPAILDHRVVTLHPKVHGGILADPTKDSHKADMSSYDIEPIDLVVVNLYPFNSNPSVELIDIGGPAMVRAAAKNHEFVGVVVDTVDYEIVLDALRNNEWNVSLRRSLAAKAFRITSAYDAAITSWLGADDVRTRIDATLPHVMTVVAERDEVLRYGENPHQVGARYRLPGAKSWWESALQLNGKEMSYLNVYDTEAAWQLVNRFDETACVIVKHANACGVAVGVSAHEVYVRANAADPVSAFGGIIAINREVDEATATEIAKVFTEVVVAPSFTAEALDILSAKSALRVLEAQPPFNEIAVDIRSIDGGLLIQTHDRIDEPRDEFTVVSKREPTAKEWRNLEIAWQVVAATWSNAITLANDGVVVGVGGGQPNRVDAARIAISRAGDAAHGAVAGSDAFFPFRDTVDELARAGVTAVIEPGGSVRDQESIDAADEHGIALIFTGTRHFRH